jgi:hypothetical protein
MIRFVGECHCCGRCCTVDRDGETYKCLHLVEAVEIGQPWATACTAYAERYDQMPIVMRAPSGKRFHGFCGKDSPAEAQAIVQLGFGRGCSLQVMP